MDDIYSAILNTIIDLAEDISGASGIVIGPLPPENGLSMTIAGGGPPLKSLGKSALEEINLVFNGKHQSQKTVANLLGIIHAELNQMRKFPEHEEFQIYDISTGAVPHYIEHENNKQWLYGSSLKVKFIRR